MNASRHRVELQTISHALGSRSLSQVVQLAPHAGEIDRERQIDQGEIGPLVLD